MGLSRRELGEIGEKLAADYLSKLSYRIIDTNYRCPEGEIDIVAKHHDSLVFVEVRSKTSGKFGSPEESITVAKKARIRAVAQRYQQEHSDLPSLWRIDVVAIELTLQGEPLRVELIENAVNDI